MLGVFVFLAQAGAARANEGVIQLSGKTEADGRCFATSIFIDGNYKLLMTCRGLQMALDPVLNKYVVWANVAEKKQRLGEVVSGKLSSTVGEKFDSLFVTLEADGYPSKPSINMVLNGKVEPIDFGTGVFNSNIAPVPSVSVVPGGQARPSPEASEGNASPTAAQSGGQAKNMTGAVVAVGKAILFGFIILLIIVGVMSFLARRKNL